MIRSKAPSAEVNLRKSSGGVFEITVDGALRFSKREKGRFPTAEEVAQSVA